MFLMLSSIMETTPWIGPVYLSAASLHAVLLWAQKKAVSIDTALMLLCETNDYSPFSI